MNGRAILTLNGGSSTLKCGLFSFEPEPVELARRTLDGGGSGGLTAARAWAVSIGDGLQIVAIGHRIVHGGPLYQDPQRVTPPLLEDLRSLVPFAPNHLPR